MTTLALLWICWCVLHSLLITGTLNEWIQKQGGFLQGSYRIVYILFSLITLVPVLWYQYTLPQQLLFAWSGSWRILQGLLLVYAFIMFYGGKQVYDSDYFLGLCQWRNYRRKQKTAHLPFTCHGILRYVRHPWYSGGLAFLWGLGPLTDVTLMVRIILSLYLVIGTLLEERKLVRELGKPYRLYCRQVPMLIPWRGKVEVNLKGDNSSGDQQE
jgi:protein-S-isoprenylcysteine O-methyltransferase Ste14